MKRNTFNKWESILHTNVPAAYRQNVKSIFWNTFKYTSDRNWYDALLDKYTVWPLGLIHIILRVPHSLYINEHVRKVLKVNGRHSKNLFIGYRKDYDTTRLCSLLTMRRPRFDDPVVNKLYYNQLRWNLHKLGHFSLCKRKGKKMKRNQNLFSDSHPKRRHLK